MLLRNGQNDEGRGQAAATLIHANSRTVTEWRNTLEKHEPTIADLSVAHQRVAHELTS